MSKNTDIKGILNAVSDVSALGVAIATIFDTSEKAHLRKNFRLIYKYFRKTRRQLEKGGLTEGEKAELEEIKVTVRKALNKIA